MSDELTNGDGHQNLKTGDGQETFKDCEGSHESSLDECPPDLCPQRTLETIRFFLRPTVFGPAPAGKWEKDKLRTKGSRAHTSVYDLIHNCHKTDLEIHIGSFVFHAHAMVLRQFSRFFRVADPSKRYFRFDPEHITPPSFILLYKWMTGTKLSMKREGYLELFKAAVYLDVKNLENQFWLYFDNASHFRGESAFKIYLDARGHSLEWLQKLMCSRVSNYFLKVVSSKEFAVMPPWAVCAMLGSDCIAVNSEMEVFLAALRWLMHDWKSREEYAVAVLGTVQFNALPLSFLMWLIKCKDTPELQIIVNSRKVQPRIYQGLGYFQLTLYYRQEDPVFFSKLQENGWKKPNPREFIFDAKCAYHIPKDGRIRKAITVAEFDAYLDQLRNDTGDGTGDAILGD